MPYLSSSQSAVNLTQVRLLISNSTYLCCHAIPIIITIRCEPDTGKSPYLLHTFIAISVLTSSPSAANLTQVRLLISNSTYLCCHAIPIIITISCEPDTGKIPYLLHTFIAISVLTSSPSAVTLTQVRLLIFYLPLLPYPS